MRSLIVSKLELRNLFKSYMLPLEIIILIISPFFIEKSNLINHIDNARFVAYTLMHALCMLGGFIIPFQIFQIFYQDQTTDISQIIYSNPILAKQYIIGKYLASVFNFLQFALISTLISIIYPIFFDLMPFYPQQFILAFLVYLLPSIIFYTALCLFLEILFRHSIISVVLCIFLFIFSDTMPEKFRFILRGSYLKCLTNNFTLSQQFINNIIVNRLLYILLAIILTTNTPTYKLVISRYLISFLLGQVILILLFLLAWLKGIEPNILEKYSIVLLYSLFLSLLGLLISNITKNTVIGYIVPSIYCLSQIIIGISYLEKYVPLIATGINLQLTEHILMGNIYFTIFSVIILLIINLFYLSKGEKIKHNLIFSTIILIICCYTTLGIYSFIKYNNESAFGKFIYNKPVYIIGTKDKEIAKYLDSKNIDFLSKDIITMDDINQNNTIIISSKNSYFVNSAKKLLDLNLLLKNNGIVSNKSGIYNISSYGILLKNPFNKDVLLSFIECTNTHDLDYIINNPKGNFLGVKNGKPMIKSNCSLNKFNISNVIKNSTILNNDCLLMNENNTTTLLYRNINAKDAINISNLWEMINTSLETLNTNNKANNILKVYFKEKQNNNDKVLSICINDTKSLESDSLYNTYNNICYEILSNQILKNIKDPDLKKGWIEYMTNVYIPTNILKKYNSKPLCLDSITLEGIKSSYLEEMQLSSNNKENNIHKVILASKMLNSINTKGKIESFIKDVSTNDKTLTNSELKTIYSNYLGPKAEKNDFNNFK
ncbi:ABC transporter permease [Clostridium tetani]|uniref:ABC transporter permease n=1 Tax=Clostridium tetani TaxID=1513 RepID=UPI002953FB49|nr:hypothetical protein [Clostridium tetani]BDR65760.1 hypothetical protein K134307016_p10710 [Clostridium tetani]